MGLALIVNASPCFPADVDTQNKESKHLTSGQDTQPQGLPKEPQKNEQPIEDTNKLINELFEAIQSNNLERVKESIAQGVDVNVRDNSGDTPLRQAIRTDRPSLSLIETLISGGADINAKAGGNGGALLHSAAYWGHKEVVELLIASGADVDVKDLQGQTPLDTALLKGRLEIFELLINNSADGTAILSSIARSGNVKYLELILLNKGADIDAKDNFGLTALHYAVTGIHREIIVMLLEHNASVNAKDNAGRTPLHYASGAAPALAPRSSVGNQISFVDIVELLLDNGVDINDQDNSGWTPLHYAAAALDKGIVGFLIAKGSDLSVVDSRGNTAYSWNRERAAFLARHAIGTPHELISQYNDIAELLRVNNEAYIVAMDGEDSNPGTLEKPFKTIAAALECVGPGNIIYIRGGIYRCENSIRLDKSGAQANPIWLRAYPGEQPILDFSGVRGDSIFVSGAYWHIKGLVIANGSRGVMVWGPGACHNILEQVTTYANGWGGILLRDGAAYNVILNCDSYKNFDPEFDGDTCDGFSAAFFVGQGNIFMGNRSWNNSDDGYDCWRAGKLVRFERCYAWNNGENVWNHPFFFGNANGFKLGRGGGRHVLINCVVWGHSYIGFNLNNNTSGVILRNCTAWSNRTNYSFNWRDFPKEARKNCVFINNMSCNGGRPEGIHREATSQNNSWNTDLNLVLTDNDFLTLDDSQMSAPRNPDGSIPQNNFLRLAPGSAAIDRGVDVGMPFVGPRPDLGAFEYDPNDNSSGYLKMLHQAVRDHDVKQIEQLLAQEEGINDKDWLGYTPLHWAVYFGYSDLIELLISRGADPDIQSDTGRHALEIARAMAYPELEALLRKLGAKAGDVSTDEGLQETKAAEK